VTTNAHELGATVGAWNAVVRRARIGRERKAAALVVSSYAHANGTGIHCGVARLAVDLEVSYSTAKRNLAWLRNVGLIELVRAGNRRRNLSDEYRLVLGPDVLESLEVLDPDEHKKLTDDFREANRGSSKVTRNGPVDNPDCGSSRVTPDPAESAEDCGSSRVTPKTGTAGQIEVFCGSPMGEPPPRLCTSPKDLPPRTTTDDEDLGGRVTVGAEETSKSPSARVVEIFPGAAQEARYRPPPRWSTSGQDTIAEASARVAARKAAHAAAAQQSETGVS
jgi:hypothetical protein